MPAAYEKSQKKDGGAAMLAFSFTTPFERVTSTHATHAVKGISSQGKPTESSHQGKPTRSSVLDDLKGSHSCRLPPTRALLNVRLFSWGEVV